MTVTAGGIVLLTPRTRLSGRRPNRVAPIHALAGAAFQAMADSILHPTIFLAAIVFLFGGTEYQIASFAVIAVVAWTSMPIVLHLLGSFASQSSIVLSALAVRSLAVIVIGLTGIQISDMSTSRVVNSLVISYLIYQTATAVASQASSGSIANTLQPPINHSGRRSIAVVAAVIGALTCLTTFRTNQLFQISVGHLLILAAAGLCAATWFCFNMHHGTLTVSTTDPQRSIRLAVDSLKSAAVRRYISYKMLLALAAAVDPFLIVYGFQELGLSVKYIGWALVAYAAGQLIGQMIWPRWISGHSPRVPFQIAIFLRLLLLSWIVTLPTLATSTVYTDRFDGGTVAMRGFATGFVLLGLASSVGNTANQRYLLDIAPTGSAKASINAVNAAATAGGFAPFGVAWLMQQYDLEHIMWGAMGAAIIALLASGLLVESRVRIRQSTGSWRSRRKEPRAARY